MSKTEHPGVSRRSFIKSVGVSAAGTAAAGAVDAARAEVREYERQSIDNVPSVGPDPTPVSLNVNGETLKANVDPATTLLDMLRWSFNLTGTKPVCDRGACGACSVIMNGKLVTSCMTLALDADGAEITTVEGLAQGDTLDPVQEAFIRHDALQCGFCTPGLLVASRDLLNRTPKPSMAEIRHGLSGNLCRCGTYTNVFNAVLEASGQPVSADESKGGGE